MAEIRNIFDISAVRHHYECENSYRNIHCQEHFTVTCSVQMFIFLSPKCNKIEDFFFCGLLQFTIFRSTKQTEGDKIRIISSI